jgi:hypothetical protein
MNYNLPVDNLACFPQGVVFFYREVIQVEAGNSSRNRIVFESITEVQ